MTLASLQAAYPWPESRPLAPQRHGWLVESTREVLGRMVGGETRVVVELGSWLGESALWLLERAPNAVVVCVDTWLGSRDHHHPMNEYRRMLPSLYERFLSNTWEHRGRVVPLRADTLTGLGVVADHGVKPDLVYIDAGHDVWSVQADVAATLDLHPDARVVGDDWGHPGVQAGVLAAVRGRRPVKEQGNAWWLE